jgi:hypothetical protein
MWTLRSAPERNLLLLDHGGGELGRLVRPGLWGNTAEVVVPGGLHTVLPKRWYSSTVVLRFGELPIAEVRFGISAVVARRADTGTELFRIVQPSIWRSRREMRAPDGRPLAVIDARTHWNRMDRAHTIAALGGPPPEPLHLLLALEALHRQYRRQVAASVG